MSVENSEALDPYETYARDLLAPTLGPFRIVDVRGDDKEGLHDFEIDLSDGSTGAIEVTSTANAMRNSLAREIDRRLSDLIMPGSKFTWTVSLKDDARVKDVTPNKIRSFLRYMEINDIKDSHRIGSWLHPVVTQLRELHIFSIHALQTIPGEGGKVFVLMAPFGGWGWNAEAIDGWLEGFIGSRQGQNKLKKLARASASERHLVIVLDPWSQEGLSLPLALISRYERTANDYGIPSFVPPEPLTHIWILPPIRSEKGLRWSRSDGWSVLTIFDAA